MPVACKTLSMLHNYTLYLIVKLFHAAYQHSHYDSVLTPLKTITNEVSLPTQSCSAVLNSAHCQVSAIADI